MSLNFIFQRNLKNTYQQEMDKILQFCLLNSDIKPWKSGGKGKGRGKGKGERERGKGKGKREKGKPVTSILQNNSRESRAPAPQIIYPKVCPIHIFMWGRGIAFSPSQPRRYFVIRDMSGRCRLITVITVNSNNNNSNKNI